MLTIRDARFRQVLERGGRRYAEVEVETDRRHSPRLLAYFRREGNGRYQLVRVIAGADQPEEEAGSGELYAAADNDLAAQMFSGPGHGGEEDRAQFGRRIVDFGDIRGQLDHYL